MGVSVQSQDVEGDEVSLSLSWSVDGTIVQTEEVTSSQTTTSWKGFILENQVVSLSVTAQDALENNNDCGANRGINLPHCAFDKIYTARWTSNYWASVEADDIVVVDVPSTDDDGDAITYSVLWEESGNPWTGSVATTTIPGDTIPASETQIGNVFTCTMIANDGQDDGGK